MIPGSANPLLLATPAAAGGLQIERSIRLNSADSAYFSRTPAVAGNRRTWTWAAWVKRSALGQQVLFSARVGTSQSRDAIRFDSDDTLQFDVFDLSTANIKTTQVFRDLSAWYHIVLAVDTTQSTASNRVKFYVNGSQITQFGTATYPSQNSDTNVNATQPHGIGVHIANPQQYLSGYLTNIHFIDGQQLTPSSFTETDATTGQLIPKTYTGTYGTNGFNLLFADNSSNTASTLGKDTSPNGNNFTPNNLSVTAGAGNDSLVDSPTNYGTDTGVGGEARGNYATLNPLSALANAILANGNLDWSTTQTGSFLAQSTIAMPSGKWYCEFTATSGNNMVGLQRAAGTPSTAFVGGNADSWGYYGPNGNKYNNGSPVAYGASYTTSDVVGIAFDADNGTLTFYKNGSSQGQAYSGLTSGPYTFAVGNGANCFGSFNFGQRAFAYTAPSGFKALCTQNLPEGTITTSGTYTGNGVADGPFVYLNGVPTAMTVGINAVTFGTDADKLSNGFKLRTTNVLYNQNALSYSYSITTTGAKFKYARAQPNP